MKNNENITKEQLLKEIEILKANIALIEKSSYKNKKPEIIEKDFENKYNNLIENLIEGFYIASLDGVLIEYNDEFVRILGLDSKKNYNGIKLPNFWQNAKDREVYVDEFLKNGYIKNYIVHAKKADGANITVKVNSRLMKDENGEPNRISGTFLDVTKQTHTEESLMESEIKFKSLFNSMTDGVCLHELVYDDDGKAIDYRR